MFNFLKKKKNNGTKLLDGLCLLEGAGFKVKELYVTKERLREMESSRIAIDKEYKKAKRTGSYPLDFTFIGAEWSTFCPAKDFDPKLKIKGRILGVDIQVIK